MTDQYILKHAYDSDDNGDDDDDDDALPYLPEEEIDGPPTENRQFASKRSRNQYSEEVYQTVCTVLGMNYNEASGTVPDSAFEFLETLDIHVPRKLALKWLCEVWQLKEKLNKLILFHPVQKRAGNIRGKAGRKGFSFGSADEEVLEQACQILHDQGLQLSRQWIRELV